MAADPRARGLFASSVLGVRGRTTAVATVVVALALAVAGLAAVELQRRDLRSNIERTTVLRADDIAALLEAGALPDELAVRQADEALIQIVGPQGDVIGASANAAGLPPVVTLAPPPGAVEVTRASALPLVDDDPFVVVARGAAGPGGTYTVLVGASLESVGSSAASLRAALVLAVPPLLLFVAVTTWFVSGRALRPVEHIRSEVASIGGTDLARRVEEPVVLDEVGRLARTMNAMLARLEDAQRRQDRFVTDASHELKSPITAIRSQLEVQLRSDDATGWAEVARAALDELDRMDALVVDLLALQQAVETSDHRVHVDLDDIVFSEVDRLRPRATVAFDVAGVSGAQVEGNARMLARAVANLLENAQRHAHHRVTIVLGESDGLARLVVTDDGQGVPADAATRIFERFTRVDEARDRLRGGTGLGLAIVREVVERHGGTIRVDLDGGRGARFIVELPLPARD